MYDHYESKSSSVSHKVCRLLALRCQLKASTHCHSDKLFLNPRTSFNYSTAKAFNLLMTCRNRRRNGFWRSNCVSLLICTGTQKLYIRYIFVTLSSICSCVTTSSSSRRDQVRETIPIAQRGHGQYKMSYSPLC